MVSAIVDGLSVAGPMHVSYRTYQPHKRFSISAGTTSSEVLNLRQRKKKRQALKQEKQEGTKREKIAETHSRNVPDESTR
jgi:hypothetical protein